MNVRSVITFAVMAALLCAGSLARAQGERGERGRRGPGPERMKQLIEEFDTDGDGELSQDERRKARETMMERRGERGDRDREARPDGARRRGPGARPEGRRRGPGAGPEGRGRGPGGPPEGRRRFGPGPGGPPDGDRPRRPDVPSPEKLFDEFDADEDGSLSKDEFMKLAGHVRERMGPPGGPGARGPGGPGGRGFDGPPRGRGFGPPGERGDRRGPPQGRRGGPRGPRASADAEPDV